MDGVAEPADDRGFTFVTYLAGSTLHIIGTPAQAAGVANSLDVLCCPTFWVLKRCVTGAP